MQANHTTNHIVDYPLSLEIYNLGFRLPCRYYYDKWKFLKAVYPIPPSKKEGMQIIPAYEIGELLEYLPPLVRIFKDDTQYQVLYQNPKSLSWSSNAWVSLEGKSLANLLASLLIRIISHVHNPIRNKKVRSVKNLPDFWDAVLPSYVTY